MRISEFGWPILVFTGFLLIAPAVAQKQLAQSPRILSAKTVYFDNQTGSDAAWRQPIVSHETLSICLKQSAKEICRGPEL
jgi:hypothetical protein